MIESDSTTFVMIFSRTPGSCVCISKQSLEASHDSIMGLHGFGTQLVRSFLFHLEKGQIRRRFHHCESRYRFYIPLIKIILFVLNLLVNLCNFGSFEIGLREDTHLPLKLRITQFQHGFDLRYKKYIIYILCVFTH